MSNLSYVGNNSPDGIVMGLDADAKIGFHGATPIVQAAAPAAATDAATVITTANALRTALINLGLIA